MRDLFIRFLVPLVLLALAIPLIRQKIPRNYFYGFRTPRTLSSDLIWYQVNRVGGIALACASIVWLLAGLIVPLTMSPEEAHGRVPVVGLIAMGVALVVSFVALWRKPR